MRFKMGWHPHCRCIATTILKTDEELERDDELILQGKEPTEGSENEVTDLPDNFTQWIGDNEERIARAKSLPYFLKDNDGLMGGAALDRAITKVQKMAIAAGEDVQRIAERIAFEYGAVCTPINFKSESSIKRKVFKERQVTGNPIFSPERLKDTVRTTIIADSKQIESILTRLKQEKCFIRLKRQNTELGYTGNIVNIMTRNGLIAEIQVNTAKMIYAKETPVVARNIIGDKLWNKIRRETGMEGGLGHKYYEEYRMLTPDSAKAKEIVKKSREYYSHFK